MASSLPKPRLLFHAANLAFSATDDDDDDDALVGEVGGALPEMDCLWRAYNSSRSRFYLLSLLYLILLLER